MGKYKQYPKYNVVSIRVSDEEKALLDYYSATTICQSPSRSNLQGINPHGLRPAGVAGNSAALL